MAKKKTTPPVKTVDRGTLPEVTVTAKAPEKKPMVMPKASVDSSAVSKVKAPVSNSKAPEPKKLGRLATAASDATSGVRGAANMAFGKNQSKTTGGKIAERVARVGAAGLGVGVAKQAAVAGATKAITTAAKAGRVSPIGTAIATAGTVAAGQAAYKNRSAESTRQGLLNPGKGKTNLPVNFDKPFQRKAAASDTTGKAGAATMKSAQSDAGNKTKGFEYKLGSKK
jgi:hypothetical protein